MTAPIDVTKPLRGAAFGAFIAAEIPRWRDIVRLSGAQLD